jgi:hypothetical protein
MVIKMIKSKTHILFSFALFFCLIANNSVVHASYDRIMKTVDEQFEKTDSKLSIVTKPMNRTYVSQLKNDQEVDFEKLYTIPNPYGAPEDLIKNRTHALGLAICAGDESRVQKFLSVVKNPKDVSLLVGGFRQLYNMAHLAVDPIWPRAIAADRNARLRIISHVALAGFELNFGAGPTILKEQYGLNTGAKFYWNPPLYVSDGSILNEQEFYKARLMLYGADPRIGGSSSGGATELSCDQVKLAFNQALEENLENLNPVQPVKEALNEMRTTKVKEISTELQQILLDTTQLSNEEKLEKIKNVSNKLQRVTKINF